MRDISSLPDDLTRILFDLGPRKLVLVEGPSDRDVFHEWFRDRLSEMEFYPAGGDRSVGSYLQIILAHSESKRAYGITDRDFRSDEEVDATLNDPTAHLFILRRYSIENYLLEPRAVEEEIRVYSGAALSWGQIVVSELAILQLCEKLRTMMAANWVLHEANCVLFSEGHDLTERDELIGQTAIRLNRDVAETERLLLPRRR